MRNTLGGNFFGYSYVVLLCVQVKATNAVPKNLPSIPLCGTFCGGCVVTLSRSRCPDPHRPPQGVEPAFRVQLIGLKSSKSWILIAGFVAVVQVPFRSAGLAERR